MIASNSGKIVVYRTIEDNKVRKLIIVAFILALILFSGGVILQIRDDASYLVPFIFFLIYPFVWLLPKLKQDYLISDSEKSVKIPTVKDPVKIELITKIEIFKNNKGVIKRVILRIPPYRYLSVQPAEKLKFINHLSRLNKNIELVEKRN